MPTSQSDYAGFTGSEYPADTYAALVRAIQGIATLFQAKIATGTEPDDDLKGLMFGEASFFNKVRIMWTGTTFVIQRNTGTESVPVWSSEVNFDFASGAIDIYNCDFVMHGNDVNVNGGNVTNAGTYNGVTITAHKSRHLPGGADELTVATPSDIGATNSEGVAANFVRGDHQHRGVRSFNTAFGDVTVAGSTGITVSGTSSTLISSNQRIYAYADNTTPSDITCTGTSIAAVTGFSSISITGADSSADYLLRFTAPLDTTGGTETTTFKMHLGTNGTTADTVIAHSLIQTDSAGTTYPSDGYVLLEAVAVNPTTSDRITISYTSTTGSRHVLQGGTDGRPILTVTRLTGFTAV